VTTLKHTLAEKFEDHPAVIIKPYTFSEPSKIYIDELEIEVDGKGIVRLSGRAFKAKKDGSEGLSPINLSLWGTNWRQAGGVDNSAPGDLLRQLSETAKERILESLRLAAPAAHFVLLPLMEVCR
jgi:hypothetical protein